MSLGQWVKRILKSSVPTAVRAGGGTFITCAPANAALKQLAAHATGGISKWGKMIELLAATANTTDCWIESLHVSQATASGEFNIALTQETGTATPTAGLIQAQLAAFVAAGTGGGQDMRISPPIYVAAGQRIAAALAGTATKKVDVAVTISRNR